MAKGIDISIAADTRSAMSAINRGLIDPLEDASEALEKLADSGDDATDDIARGMRDAQRRTDDAADEIRKLADELNRAGRQGKNTGNEIDDGLGRVKHSASEAGDELKQNLGETFSSFRGDLEDLPQIAQDVFGGLAGSVGTLPAAFGLAAGAAGIGLLVAGFQEIQKQEEERKERVAEWASAYIAGLGQMEDAVANFASVEKIYTNTELYAEAEKNAKNWGTTVATAVNAMAGDAGALAVVQQSLAERTDTVSEAIDNLNGGRIQGLSYEMRTLKGEVSEGQKSFDALTGEMSEGEARAREYSESLLQILSSAESATKEVDDLGNAVYTLPNGQQIMIDAETGQATADISKFKGDADEVIESVNGRQVVIDARATVAQAQRDLDGFVVRNNGREIKIKGKIVTAEGAWQ